MRHGESENAVVAQQHLRPVLAALDEAREIAGVDDRLYLDPETSDILELARITFPDVGRAAEAVSSWSDQQGAGADFQGLRRPPVDRPLDRLLWSLRAGFGTRFHGWMPTLGKDRLVGPVSGGQNPPQAGVSGAGEISYGGGGAPQAVRERPEWAGVRPAVTPTGVQVGLVDTAMVDHDYLTGAWVGPYADAATGTLQAEAGHATFIAGLIRQYAPAVTVQVRPVLDEHGRADAWAAAHRIVEAGRAGIDVLNLSFVCYTGDGMPPMVLAAALDRLNSDTVVVAAAGNHGYLEDGRQRTPAWPAAFPRVIAVGAATEDDCDKAASFTPGGPWIDVLAPGTNVTSTYLDGRVLTWEDPDGSGPALSERIARRFTGYASWSGTSFAAGIVSAMIATRIEPGRRSAPQAWEALLAEARAAQRERRMPDHPVILPPYPGRRS